MARVLVVSDEKKNHLTIELLLEGFEVASATSAREAFFVLEECPELDLVLIEPTKDLDVPGLVRRLRAAYPGIRVALTNGFRLSTSREDLAGWGAVTLASPPRRTGSIRPSALH
jgi:CheY-like chemotaxis protein